MVLLMWLAACDDTEFPAIGGEGVVGDTYEDVQKVFEADCYACHGAASALGGLDLETDACAAIVGVTAAGYDGELVVPGDSAASVLWTKMADTKEFGGIMPPTGASAQESIDTVAAWIDLGADCGGAR
ncbi:MAG: hypothetical protein H6738_19220 [Alphaproteobacteria bacterium]|nr:hypothetical protein [Alphaproteobacteria bacterium]MCB9698920.1 hypothetical protein [Alphaproteobacteria bacterium]